MSAPEKQGAEEELRCKMSIKTLSQKVKDGEKNASLSWNRKHCADQKDIMYYSHQAAHLTMMKNGKKYRLAVSCLEDSKIFESHPGSKRSAYQHTDQHHDLLPKRGVDCQWQQQHKRSRFFLKVVLRWAESYLRAFCWYSRAFLVSLVALVVYSTALSTCASILRDLPVLSDLLVGEAVCTCSPSLPGSRPGRRCPWTSRAAPWSTAPAWWTSRV